MDDVAAAPTAAQTAADSAPHLFEPVEIGAWKLPHRVVMAPLTRSRARQPGNVPQPLNACYYAQRASAALIISEATQVSQQGQGYAWTPGIHSRQQIDGWRLVTDAVHRAGGRILLQLWHVGRISHPALQPDFGLPVAPSAVLPPGEAFIENEAGEGALVPFVTPRALEIEEMPYIVGQFERAARNAMEAGFDGVEVHAANGYLLDQFLESGTNRRTDAYGGTVANRARLLLEVVDAVAAVWRPERVGVRLSPLSTFNGMADDEPEETFGYTATRLSERRLAYLHVVRPGDGRSPEHGERADRMMHLLRRAYDGKLLVCGGFDAAEGTRWLRENRADAIVFGRLFLANPDLPERFRAGEELNPDDPATYYGGGERGYTDYPTLQQVRGEVPVSTCTDARWR